MEALTSLRYLALLLSMGAAAHAAEVRGVLNLNGTPTADAVVYLDGGDAAPPATPAHVVMDQKNLSFLPKVLAAQRGTVVEFTNSDDVQHNVFSPSDIVSRFDLGTYNRGETRQVTLSKSGDVVVLCNIHMEMEAHIVVVEGPHFATTDAGGAFRIADVPPGQYTARVWRGGWLPQTVPVEVAGEVPALHLELRK